MYICIDLYVFCTIPIKEKINKNILQVVTGSTTSLLSFLEFVQGRRVVYINRKGLWNDAPSTRRLVLCPYNHHPSSFVSRLHSSMQHVLFFLKDVKAVMLFISLLISIQPPICMCGVTARNLHLCAPMMVPSGFFSVSTSTLP